MSSSCFSGGGRTYNLNLNLDLIKSPTSSSWTSNYSSSSSSTLSDSNSSISTRKARTPRKRPNQTYNEAASILSTAYPKLFPDQHLTKPFTNFSKHKNSPFPFEPSGLFTPPKSEKPGFSKTLSLFQRPSRRVSCWPACDDYEDFDAESILDEEVEQGIDSIMGSSSVGNEDARLLSNTCYGYPVGFGFGNGMRNESKAMKNGDEGDDWWRFPSVDLADITRKIAEIPVEKKKKQKQKQKQKKKKCLEEKEAVVLKETFRRTRGGHLLKLNYEDVLSAWADRGSPFSGDGPPAGDDVCNLISGKTNKKYKSF